MSITNFFRMRRASVPNDSGHYSCHELEGAITFIHGAITMCGYVHSNNKGMPYICDYQGGKIPVDKIITARIELIKKNQTEEDTPCKGCQFLKKSNWLKNNYLINHITVGHYTPCNLRCTYCYTTDYSQEERKKFNTPPYSASESINHIIDQKLLDPNSTAWLTGGEPTSFIDFNEIMSVLIANNVKTTIGTNCTRAPHEIIKNGLKKDLVEILCSVDSGTPETYNAIKGRNYFEDAWSNIERYTSINKDTVVLKYIFMDENSSENEVLNFINMCRTKGVKNISISRDILKYRGVLSPEQIDMPSDMYSMIVLMFHEAVKNDINVFFDINWPVFTNREIFKIKTLLLERIIKSSTWPDIGLRKYFPDFSQSFDSLVKNKNNSSCQ